MEAVDIWHFWGESRQKRESIALVCAADDPICMHFLERYAGTAANRSEITLARSYFGRYDTPVRYVIAIVPPKS